MRIWGILRKDGKIRRDIVIATEKKLPLSEDEFSSILKELCYELDLSCPLLLKKHMRDMSAFSRTAFLPGDFVESVDFDKFEIEVFMDKKGR